MTKLRKSKSKPVPFSNGLTPAEAERLAILSEECAEVIQVVSKILRHGFESKHPVSGISNRQLLESELGDLSWAMRILDRDVRPKYVWVAHLDKEVRVSKYLHHINTSGEPRR